MIQIGTRVLGEKPFIIAEIGSNWRELEDCIDSIRIASECGADAVKFQLLNYKRLYGKDKKYAPSWYDERIELPIDWLQTLRKEADQNRIEFMLSAFGLDLAAEADKYVRCHKIASGEITNKELLEEISGYGKPVFLSTGAATTLKIEAALAVLDGCSVIINYCVAAYTAQNVNLFKMDKLAKFGCPMGFSDHTTDVEYLPRAAIEHHGAVAIEKHLSCIKSNTPDSGHSLNPKDFKKMVDHIRGRREPVIGPTEEELDMLQRHQRRLVIEEDCRKGDIVQFGAYRSENACLDGINPFEAHLYKKAVANKDLKAGETLKITDVDL